MTLMVSLLLYMMVSRLVGTTNIRLISACLLAVVLMVLFQETLMLIQIIGNHYAWENLWSAQFIASTLLYAAVCGLTFNGIRRNDDSLTAYFCWTIVGVIMILAVPSIVLLIGIR